jgi:hypothetical protein
MRETFMRALRDADDLGGSAGGRQPRTKAAKAFLIGDEASSRRVGDQISAKAMSASKNWTMTMFELPGVIEDGMPGRNGQRKPGTARGSRTLPHSEGIPYKSPCGEGGMCPASGADGE